MQFYSVSHNSFEGRGFPWAQEIVHGFTLLPPCPECGRSMRSIPGEITVGFTDKGSKWPDVLGCGHVSLLIVSERVLEDWRRDGIGEFPNHEVHLDPPMPRRLRNVAPPGYFWIDGSQIQGARLDYDASGIVIKRFCPKCDARIDDIPATFARHYAGGWPIVFQEGTWNGASLFTTDTSPYQFYCTQDVVDCARRNRHTNFRFIPIEEGLNARSKGLPYLK